MRSSTSEHWWKQTVTFLAPCSVKHSSLEIGHEDVDFYSISLLFPLLTLAKSSPEAMALTLSQNRPAGRTERSDGAVGTSSGTILSWMEWFQPPSQKHKLILKKKKKARKLGWASTAAYACCHDHICASYLALFLFCCDTIAVTAYTVFNLALSSVPVLCTFLL